MKNQVIMVFLVILVAACSRAPEATIEERVLMEAFGSYQAAVLYDEVCNEVDPKNRFENLDDAKNINLIGNEQMLAARLGGLQHLRFPDKTVEELVKKLIEASNTIKQAARKKLGEIGCDSPELETTKNALILFSRYHPAQIYALIDKEITKRGGTVTSPEEIEAVGKPPSKPEQDTDE